MHACMRDSYTHGAARANGDGSRCMRVHLEYRCKGLGCSFRQCRVQRACNPALWCARITGAAGIVLGIALIRKRFKWHPPRRGSAPHPVLSLSPPPTHPHAQHIRLKAAKRLTAHVELGSCQAQGDDAIAAKLLCLSGRTYYVILKPGSTPEAGQVHSRGKRACAGVRNAKSAPPPGCRAGSMACLANVAAPYCGLHRRQGISDGEARSHMIHACSGRT